MKEEMLEFLEKGQIPIYFEERKIIKEFIETFFDHYQSKSSKHEDEIYDRGSWENMLC